MIVESILQNRWLSGSKYMQVISIACFWNACDIGPKHCIVRKGVQAPPFFMALTFLFHPLLRYFRQFLPPSRNPLLP